ncbi:MAG TPA: DUF488 family protein [Gaiellaceae bacterium]|nr:DUF488 family protein [Gaiellaceae bacterium]
MTVATKRIYEPASSEDGYRVLIDRLWPRGVMKEQARIDEWARDLAPSDELRRWFAHRPERFERFRARYVEELRAHADHLAELRRRARGGKVTVVFAARDAGHSNAAVLAPLLRRGFPRAD